MKQNRKEYEEKQRLKNEFNKKREKEIEDFMETDQYKDHNQFVSNELYKIIGVLLIILVFMKMFTSAWLHGLSYSNSVPPLFQNKFHHFKVWYFLQF